ncbi:MAG: PilZ domain-containing protein [bacterium]|nr:PilZ domain-containing protein [bacterium]
MSDTSRAASKSEKREDVRVQKKLIAKYKDKECAVLNVSSKGVLLETTLPVYLFPVSDIIIFELELDGLWMCLNGTVQWTAAYPGHSRVGLSINNAPAPFMDFLQNQYI